MATLPSVRLHQNMSMQQLIAALNENFNLLQNQAQTITIKDEAGNVRIVIGRLPDNSHGIVVTKPGYNVGDLFT